MDRALNGRGSSWAEDPGSPPFVTVGCANFATVPFDLPATLAKMEAVLRDAHRQGCQLVAFPEHAVNSSGRSDDPQVQARIDRWHLDEAELVPGPTTEFVARLAAELDLYVVFGMAERDADHADRIYNAAAIVGPEGILGTYRKLHLGHPSETVRFTPGDELPVWQTKLGPIGVLICYDFWSNPELSRVLALKGARLIINPTASAEGPGKADYNVNTTIVRAHENLIYAMSANNVGDGGDGRGGGNSVIAGPAFPRFRHVLARAGTEEELIVATLNFHQLGRWHDLFPWRTWRLDPARQLHMTRLVGQELLTLADDVSSPPS